MPTPNRLSLGCGFSGWIWWVWKVLNGVWTLFLGSLLSFLRGTDSVWEVGACHLWHLWLDQGLSSLFATGNNHGCWPSYVRESFPPEPPQLLRNHPSLQETVSCLHCLCQSQSTFATIHYPADGLNGLTVSDTINSPSLKTGINVSKMLCHTLPTHFFILYQTGSSWLQWQYSRNESFQTFFLRSFFHLLL